MPHSSIMRHGLMPVPPGAPSMVSRSILASLRPLDGHGQLAHGVGAGLERDALEARARAAARTSARKPSSSTKPRRLCRSNCLMAPSLNAAWMTGSDGSGVTM